MNIRKDYLSENQNKRLIYRFWKYPKAVHWKMIIATILNNKHILHYCLTSSGLSACNSKQNSENFTKSKKTTTSNTKSYYNRETLLPLTDLFLSDKNVFNTTKLHVLKSSSVRTSKNVPSFFVCIHFCC